jgi:hypothetical protein
MSSLVTLGILSQIINSREFGKKDSCSAKLISYALQLVKKKHFIQRQ